MATKEDLEEKGRGRTMKAEEESNKPRTIYWVMPSYTQPFKHQIMQILDKEKINLCKNKTFEKFLPTLPSKLHLQTTKTSNN